IFKQKTERLPSLAEARSDVPERLCRLIERATEKDPAARWQDAPEFLANLTGAPAEPAQRTSAPTMAPVPAAAVSPAEFPTIEFDQAALATAIAEEGRADEKRMRSRRQRFMAAAVLVLLFTGGAGALAFSGRESESGTLDDRSVAFSAEQSMEDDYMLPVGSYDPDGAGELGVDPFVSTAADSAAKF